MEIKKYRGLNPQAAEKPTTNRSNQDCLPVPLQSALPVRKQTGETQEALDQSDVLSEKARDAWMTPQGCI